MPITRKGKQVAQMLAEFKAFRAKLPQLVGTEAVAFFKQSFRRQGWIDGGGVEKWKKRATEKKGNKGRGILMLRGTLRRSIRIISKTATSVSVGTDVPYAKIHNEGGTIKGTIQIRAHSRKLSARRGKSGQRDAKGRYLKGSSRSDSKVNVQAHSRQMNINMPKRQYMGQSKFFDRRIRMQTDHELKRILEAK